MCLIIRIGMKFIMAAERWLRKICVHSTEANYKSLSQQAQDTCHKKVWNYSQGLCIHAYNGHAQEMADILPVQG